MQKTFSKILGDNRIRLGGPLVFYGENAAGRRVQFMRIVRQFEEETDKAALYADAREFLGDFVGAVRNRNRAWFETKYRDSDLLIIDNVQLIAGKEQTQEELLKVLKESQIRNNLVVLGFNRHPYLIQGLSEDLKGFSQGGLLLGL